MADAELRRRRTADGLIEEKSSDVKLGMEDEEVERKQLGQKKSMEVDPLLTEVINHIQRIGFHITALFVFYLLGRMGLVWTTLLLSIVGYYLIVKMDSIKKKLSFLLHFVQPKDTDNVREHHITSRPRDLPRWVRFPDEESVHWLNNIIQALWPLISQYADSKIRSEVQPILDEKVPPKLKPVSLHQLDFGSIAPLVGSIQVYDEEFTKRDEIIMDMELYYAGNSNFSVTVKDHVAAKLSDVQFFGHSRLVLSPLSKQMPLIDAIQFYFTRAPQIFWRGKKLLYLLEFPKVNDMIMEQVLDQMAKFVIFPNAFCKQLRDKSKDKFTIQSPIADGVLRIAVRGARNLANKDTFGKSDPYCVTVVGSTSFKTKVVEDNLNPVWNEFYELPIYNPAGMSVDFFLFDEDVNNDESLGGLSIPLTQIKKEGFIDTSGRLVDTKKGEIQVQLQYCHLVPKIDESADKSEPVKTDVVTLTEKATSEITECFGAFPSTAQSFSQCYVNVFIDSASNLPRNHPTDMRAYPSPYVKISIPGYPLEKQTKVVKDMSNPVWEQSFDFLGDNTEDKIIKFEVFDSEKNTQSDGQVQAMIGQTQSMLGHVGLGHTTHRVIGSVKVPLRDVMKSPNLTLESPFTILSSSDSQILVKITAKFLLKGDPNYSSGKDLDDGEDFQDSHGKDGGTNEPGNAFRPDYDGTYDDSSPGSKGPDSGDYGKGFQGAVENNNNYYGTLDRKNSGRMSKKATSIRSMADAIPVAKLFLKIRYAREFSRLIVQVDKAEGLFASKLLPYVEVKLKPDEIKKQTDFVKTLSSQQGSVPSLQISQEIVQWNKVLEFIVPQHDLSNKILQAKVKNHATFPRSDTCFGYVSIPLYTMPLEAPFQSWFLVTPKPQPTPLY